MSKVDVPGGWISLRDPKRVKERDRRPIMAKAASLRASMTDEANLDLIGAYELNDLVAVALIESWSFGDTVSIEVLTDLESTSYDAIQKVTAPLLAQLMPSFEPTPDPDSPTGPSGA
jgi:hypothetical protein